MSSKLQTQAIGTDQKQAPSAPLDPRLTLAAKKLAALYCFDRRHRFDQSVLA